MYRPRDFVRLRETFGSPVLSYVLSRLKNVTTDGV
jgi:hypothetical protein